MLAVFFIDFIVILQFLFNGKVYFLGVIDLRESIQRLSHLWFVH